MEDVGEVPQQMHDPEAFDISANLCRETIIVWRFDPHWYPVPTPPICVLFVHATLRALLRELEASSSVGA